MIHWLAEHFCGSGRGEWWSIHSIVVAYVCALLRHGSHPFLTLSPSPEKIVISPPPATQSSPSHPQLPRPSALFHLHRGRPSMPPVALPPRLLPWPPHPRGQMSEKNLVSPNHLDSASAPSNVPSSLGIPSPGLRSAGILSLLLALAQKKKCTVVFRYPQVQCSSASS